MFLLCIKIIFLEFLFFYFSHQLMTIIKQYHMILHVSIECIVMSRVKKIKKIFNGFIQDI
jgi:hypothetical protein